MAHPLPPGHLVCHQCGSTKTPQWREGPNGPKTLCNACGVKRNRQLRAARLADVSQQSPSGSGAGSPAGTGLLAGAVAKNAADNMVGAAGGSGRGRRAAADKARKRTLALVETGVGWGEDVGATSTLASQSVSKANGIKKAKVAHDAADKTQGNSAQSGLSDQCNHRPCLAPVPLAPRHPGSCLPALPIFVTPTSAIHGPSAVAGPVPPGALGPQRERVESHDPYEDLSDSARCAMMLLTMKRPTEGADCPRAASDTETSHEEAAPCMDTIISRCAARAASLPPAHAAELSAALCDYRTAVANRQFHQGLLNQYARQLATAESDFKIACDQLASLERTLLQLDARLSSSMAPEPCYAAPPPPLPQLPLHTTIGLLPPLPLPQRPHIVTGQPVHAEPPMLRTATPAAVL